MSRSTSIAVLPGGIASGSRVMTSASFVSLALLSLRQYAVHGVAAGEDASKAAVILDHQHGADTPIPHASAGLADCRVRRQRQRILVSHNVRHFPHGHTLSRSPTARERASSGFAASRSLPARSCPHECSSCRYLRASRSVFSPLRPLSPDCEQFERLSSADSSGKASRFGECH